MAHAVIVNKTHGDLTHKSMKMIPFVVQICFSTSCRICRCFGWNRT